MEWQRSYVERDLSLQATKGIKTIDLPKSAMLSELLLRITATHGANPNYDNHLWNCISKVEVIVDGSTVVKSLTGVQLLMLAYYNTLKMPWDNAQEQETTESIQVFPILFGRFPGDLEYGLDCSKVLNPQLKITWDTTGAGLDATSLYSTSTYPVLDLNALQLLDGAGMFAKGYIKSHEIETWSPTTNSEIKRVELPTGNVYRRLFIRNFSTDWWPWQSLKYTYLDLNIGVKQPFKMDTEEWVTMNREQFGLITVRRHIAVKSGQVHRDSFLGQTCFAFSQPVGAWRSGFLYGGSGQHWQFEYKDDLTDALITTGVEGFMVAHGDCYQSGLVLPFDWPDDRFLLDSRRWTDVDLVLEAASAGISTILPSIAIILEEIIKG